MRDRSDRGRMGVNVAAEFERSRPGVGLAELRRAMRAATSAREARGEHQERGRQEPGLPGRGGPPGARFETTENHSLHLPV